MITQEEALLFIRYLRPYRVQIIKISVLAVICAFFEALNLGAIVPLLQMLNSPTPPGGMLWDILKSIFTFFSLELNFINLLIAMGAIFLVDQAILYKKKRMQANLWFVFSADIKKMMFETLLKADILYHYSEKTGKFVDILNRQAEYAATTIFAVTEIFTYFFFIMVYTGILLYISMPLTIICLVIALMCLYLLNTLIRQSKQIGTLSNNTNIRMNEFITERLGLLKLIKIFSTENLENKKLTEITAQYAKNNTDFWMNGVKIETSFQIIIFGIALSILYVSTIVLNLPLAMLLVFIFILIRLTDPLRQINQKRHELGGELASLEVIDRTLQEATSHESKSRGTNGRGTKVFETVNDTIELAHVSFSYIPSQPVICDVSFSVKKREMVALVGASGGGKSTLVDLIIRIIEPDSGQVLIDGIDIRNFDIQKYHRKIGFVSQECYIFNDSVLNNICYGAGTVNSQKTIEAAKTANAHEFIVQLSEGYDTQLGERGVKLSGGQKQRIALARAIYKEPEILILDEATSALDSEAERVIQQSVLSIKNKYTIIAIAHRLSTIENADRILVIENGQIMESGTHRDLITEGGTYAKYYSIQYKSSENGRSHEGNR